MDLYDFPCKVIDGVLVLNVYVQPGAKNSSIEKFMELDNQLYLKVKIAAPAVDNKANKELISFLSDEFKVSKSSVTLLKGQNSRQKKLGFGKEFEGILNVLKLYKPMFR
jgi:uncharacterized protein (TIGR00251 family)